MKVRSKKAKWSTPLPRPITIPTVMTLKTLADVRKLLSHIPKELRQLSTWQHVEKTLQACAAGEEPANIRIALQRADLTQVHQKLRHIVQPPP
jgi:hypothetical protein